MREALHANGAGLLILVSESVPQDDARSCPALRWEQAMQVRLHSGMRHQCRVASPPLDMHRISAASLGAGPHTAVVMKQGCSVRTWLAVTSSRERPLCRLMCWLRTGSAGDRADGMSAALECLHAAMPTQDAALVVLCDSALVGIGATAILWHNTRPRGLTVQCQGVFGI